MGDVYRATHLELGVSVAVKLLRRTASNPERAVKRFRREARAAARLKSAHIVHVYDFGVEGDVPFLVMELLQGEALSERLARQGTLCLEDAAGLIQQASRGLAVAHADGIVHRDVKPSNLFLSRTVDGEVLKVLDFGIAKPEDEDVTVTASQEIIGSPLYMSPEQANGGALDQRADVWSLAAVAFRMITGVDAFRAATASSILVKICSGAPPKASLMAPELPPELDAFFAKAFARDPAARFQSTGELAEAFTRAARVELDRASQTGTEFFRTDATALLELGRTRPEGRVPRWPWIVLGAIALAAPLAWLHQRPAPEVSRSPSSGSPPSAPVVARPAVPRDNPMADRAATAPSTPSADPTPPRRVRARTSARNVSNAAATAAPRVDKNARDPLFGL